MGVGGCHWICQYLRSDTVGAVITEHCAIPPPGDSGGRTTSGGAGEGEHRRVSGWVSVQLEGDFIQDSNLACWNTELVRILNSRFSLFTLSLISLT